MFTFSLVKCILFAICTNRKRFIQGRGERREKGRREMREEGRGERREEGRGERRCLL